MNNTLKDKPKDHPQDIIPLDHADKVALAHSQGKRVYTFIARYPDGSHQREVVMEDELTPNQCEILYREVVERYNDLTETLKQKVQDHILPLRSGYLSVDMNEVTDNITDLKWNLTEGGVDKTNEVLTGEVRTTDFILSTDNIEYLLDNYYYKLVMSGTNVNPLNNREVKVYQFTDNRSIIDILGDKVSVYQQGKLLCSAYVNTFDDVCNLLEHELPNHLITN